MVGATRRGWLLPFFWGLSLGAGWAAEDEGVAGDDGCSQVSWVRGGREGTHI